MTQSGNEVGLREAEFHALTPGEQEARRSHARATLAAAGAHLVIDGIWELPAAIELLSARLRQGDQP